MYEEAAQRSWSVGDRIQSYFPNVMEYYFCTIIGFDRKGSDSLWNSVLVQWDDENPSSDRKHTRSTSAAVIGENLSPWEIEPLLTSSRKSLKSKQRSLSSITEENRLKYLEMIDNVMDDPEAELFCVSVPVSEYPDYPLIIPVPMDFSLISLRLHNSFYRQEAALLQDIELIESNCILYNGYRSPLSRIAMRVCQGLARDIAKYLRIKE